MDGDSGVSKSDHMLDIAREIVDDIEQQRASGENIVNKAVRLARLANAPALGWLLLEQYGYNNTEPLSLQYLAYTGRFNAVMMNQFYIGGLGAVEAQLESDKQYMQILQIPSTLAPTKPFEINPVTTITMTQSITSGKIARLGLVRSKVLGLIHTFAASVHD